MENNQINKVNDNEPVTCYEEVGARTEYSKKFNNPKTGLHTAVLFSSPVHYNNGTELVDIDNDFVDAVNDEGEAVYENRRNKFLVRLAKSTSQNKLVELIQGDCRIAMSPVASITSKINRFVSSIRQNVQAILNIRRSPKITNKIAELVHDSAKFALRSQDPADIRFSNAIQNCDLEYLVESNRVKENIIVNSKSEAYEYMFNLKLDKLEARMIGKQIELYVPETNEVKFIIPEPYMYDMDGQQSDAVSYILDGHSGNYTLRIVADESWINAAERKFPVTIDPQIMGNSTSIIQMQNEYGGGIMLPTGDKITLGNNHYDGVNHIYGVEVRINGESIRNSIGKDVRVLHAILELTKAESNQPADSKGFLVSVAGGPGINIPIDRFTYNGINNRIDIDITSLIQSSIDYGSNILLKLNRRETSSVTDYIVLMTHNAYVSEYRPRIFIDYVSSRLETSDMAFLEPSAGRAGNGKINLNNLGVKWEHQDITVRDGALELPISHIYDGNIAGVDYDSILRGIEGSEVNTNNFGCGKGFKLNIHQRLISKPNVGAANLLGSQNKVYIDGNGNHHDFVEKYYYVQDNYPHYVNREDCLLKANGGLEYMDNGIPREITYEVSNELGMTLESYSRYVDYATGDREYESRYCFVAEGKRYYVERSGNYATVPMFCRALDRDMGSDYYVPVYEVTENNGKFYDSFGYEVEQVFEKQRITGNKIFIKKTEMLYKASNTYAVPFELIEERIYNDDTALIIGDFISTDDIDNLTQQIKSLDDYRGELQENVDYYTNLHEKYVQSDKWKNELQDIQDRILNLQTLQRKAEQQRQEKLEKLQEQQLDLQFDTLKINNAIYAGENGEHFSDYVAEQTGKASKYPRVPLVVISGGWFPNIHLSVPMIPEDVKKLRETLSGISDDDTLDTYIKNALKGDDSNTELAHYRNLVDNLSYIKQSEILTASKVDYTYTNLIADLQDEYNEKSKEQNEREQADAIRDVQQKIDKYSAMLDEANAQISTLKMRRESLIEEQKRQPTDFIKCLDNSILGFDYYGKLVCVTDAYENLISFTYDADDNIVFIANKDNKILAALQYDKGLLSCITDKYGKTITYSYQNGLLQKITYPDGEFCEFVFNDACKMTKAIGISGENISIDYTDSELIIKQNTATERIDKNGITSCDEYAINSYDITRTSDCTTKVTTKLSETTYVFDRMGRVITAHAKSGDNEHSASYEYSGLNRSLSCDEVLSESNLIDNHDFTEGKAKWTSAIGNSMDIVESDSQRCLQLFGEKDCYIKQTIEINNQNRDEIPKNGVMVLSAWAKAQSMSVRHNKRITAYGKDLFTEYEETASNINDVLRNNRRFGLKAVVEYSDTSMNDTSECTYDFYNKDWQFAALPIKIKDKNKVTRITVFFDYSYNNDVAYVTDFKLCKCGEFTERTYDADRKLTSEYDGKTLTEYEYNGQFPIKSVMTIDGKKYTNKMRYSDSGALLYSRDYNGNCVENTYNDKGVLIKTAKYNENDSTSKYIEEYEYDEKGVRVAEVDSRGEVNGEVLKTTYEYSMGLTVSEKRPDNQKTVYGYDYDTEAKTGMSSDDDGEANGTVYKYTKDILTTTSHNGIDVNYAYDGQGRTLETTIADDTIVSCVYTDGTTATDVDVVKATYADGTVIKTTTDNRNRKKTVEDITNGASIELLRYEYDGKTDRQKKAIDGLANITYDYAYSDELLTQTTYALHGNNIVLNDTYSDDDLLEKSDISIGGVTEQYKYAYDETPEHNLTDVELPNGVKQELERDALGRVQAISQSVEGKTIADENRYYLKYGDRTTDYISSMRFGVNGSLDEQLKYKYDKAGNISEIYKNGILLARYAYDKLNRIVREDNKALDKTVIVTYDVGGNILAKTEYPFSLGSIIDKTPNTVMSYSYKAKGWRDQMTAFNGEKCEYDSMGRPTTYRNNALTWSKYGTLSGYGNVNYSYDANGVRLSKTVAGVQTKFYISGTKILRSVDNNNDIWYNYGVSGIQGITVNNTEYVFRKNAQGDVTHIYKLSNGELSLAARYEYDAWGNHEAVELDNSGIGAINPIRYRGYYYDAETKLYYLNARYYDPETGRFISADSTQYLEPNTINGLNLYAYCASNPVMNVDPSGRFIISLLVGLCVAFAAGFAGSVISQGLEYGWNNINFLQAGIDGLFALAGAALAATGIGMAGSILLGAAMGFSQYAIGTTLHGKELTWMGALMSITFGAISGAISGAGASNSKVLAKNMTGRASQGVKALATTAQKYGIKSTQILKVMNLYGKAIHTCVQNTVNKVFTQSVIKIWSMALTIPLIQVGINKWKDYITG